MTLAAGTRLGPYEVGAMLGAGGMGAGNIMLTKGGAKLLDFGLARYAQGSPSVELLQSLATEHKPLTQEGTILGTFQYMSPEQLSGDEADARSDIFAFGAVLYEMLTGVRAFQGKNKTSLIGAIVSGEPRPVSALQPLTPPALEHVIRKCLAKEPDDRWQSAHDIAEEIRWSGEVGSQTGAAPPVAARRRRLERVLAGVALASTLGLCVAIGYLVSNSKLMAVDAVRPDAEPRVIFESLDLTSFIVAPDGKQLLVELTSDLDASPPTRVILNWTALVEKEK